MSYVHCRTAMDTVVVVGGQHFVAHREVLAEHSGYFREEFNQISQREPTIVSSLVSSRTFAVLLDYMYSSRLRLDTDAVADVLRCAQLLDMPKVVDMCRQYVDNVLQADYPPPPLPSRLWQTMFVDHHQQHLTSMFFPSTSASTRVIRPIATRQPLPFQHCHEFMSATTSAMSTAAAAAAERQQETPAKESTMSSQQRPALSSTNISPSTSDRRSYVAENIDKERENEEDDDDDASIVVDESPSEQTLSSQQKQPPSPCPEKNVVVDVAYCDGPVKFQRILNENCDLVMVLQTTIVQCKKHRTGKGGGNKQHKADEQAVAAASRKRKRTRQVDDNGSDDERGSSGSRAVGATFCVHCKHTFKSRYCYMKHKRRHLNPLTVHECEASYRKTVAKDNEEDNEQVVEEVVAGSAVETATKGDQDSDSKLLEINSTFYPCKLCGSKFPSYYFLHKHQRIMHAVTAADGQTSTEQLETSALQEAKTS